MVVVGEKGTGAGTIRHKRLIVDQSSPGHTVLSRANFNLAGRKRLHSSHGLKLECAVFNGTGRIVTVRQIICYKFLHSNFRI